MGSRHALHFNTEHHACGHIALRGIREDKTASTCPATTFVTACEPLPRIYAPGNWDISNQLDAIESERREIDERRFTSLDRAINRANTVVLAETGSNAGTFRSPALRRKSVLVRAREHHLDGLLFVLRSANGFWRNRLASGCQLVRRDFENRFEGDAAERQKSRRKMLSVPRRSALRDERLSLGRSH